MRKMTKKVIVSLALIAGILFAYSVQASACHLVGVSLDADCVEAGGEYSIEYTITADAYVPPYWIGLEYSVEYELTITSTSGNIIDTVTGASYFTCTGIPQPAIYQIVQNGSVDIPECGEYELSGEVRLKRIPTLAAIKSSAFRTQVSSSIPYEDILALDPFNVTCPCDFEGCTPGFWKNHTKEKNWDAWDGTGISPDADFDTTFGVDLFDPDITLLDAVWARGGGYNKIARHGTAALLNAAHPDVYYPLSVVQVKAIVQSGDVEILANYNEYGTPGFCD